MLETYGELSLGSYANEKTGRVVTLAPDAIATAIKDILREAHVTTKSAILSIQSQATLVFLIELPEISESELAQVIPNEARKYIPVALTEVSLDWYVVPKKETYAEESNHANVRSMMEVVVVAVRNETLSQYKEIAEKSGIDFKCRRSKSRTIRLAFRRRTQR
jgi:Tfp pilus assembly PilM family ATPase